jgi:hypothetical protein
LSLTFQPVVRRDARCFWQPPSETCDVVFSCVLTLREAISSTSCDNRISYGYDMQMYCTFVLFVNQHFPGLPASETHCTNLLVVNLYSTLGLGLPRRDVNPLLPTAYPLAARCSENLDPPSVQMPHLYYAPLASIISLA